MAAIRAPDAGNRWSPELDPQHILGGALIGIAAALAVASIMGRGLRPARAGRLRVAADRAAARRFVEHGRIAAGRVSA